jgi:hypothetical protein
MSLIISSMIGETTQRKKWGSPSNLANVLRWGYFSRACPRKLPARIFFAKKRAAATTTNLRI